VAAAVVADKGAFWRKGRVGVRITGYICSIPRYKIGVRGELSFGPTGFISRGAG